MEQEKKLIRYDLACGDSKKEGFTGVDICKTDSVDIVCDLNKYPWTFAEDNSVDEIFSSMFVEHVGDIVKFMEEIYRILKVGGTCTLIAPYYSSIRCWQDPTHVRAISEATFLYYNKKWMDENKLSHYGIKADFDYTFGYNMDPMWASRSDEAKSFAVKHYINVVSDIQVVLTKREWNQS